MIDIEPNDGVDWIAIAIIVGGVFIGGFLFAVLKIRDLEQERLCAGFGWEVYSDWKVRTCVDREGYLRSVPYRCRNIDGNWQACSNLKDNERVSPR